MHIYKKKKKCLLLNYFNDIYIDSECIYVNYKIELYYHIRLVVYTLIEITCFCTLSK